MIDSEKCPVISVVIPVYNGEKFLQGCITSIVNQTFASFEAIFIDDGSTDNSYKILSNNTLSDDRIKVIRQSNQGVTSARRNGVKAAAGKWICFVDCDDLLFPETLQILLDEIQMSGADIVCGNSSYAHRIETNYLLNPLEYIAALLERKIDIVLWAKLYRKDLLKEDVFDIPSHIKFAEDYIMNIKIGFKVDKVSCIQNLIYQYGEYSEGSVTSTFRLTTPYIQEICGYILQEITMNNVDSTLHKPKLLFLKYMIWMLIHHNALDMDNGWVRKVIREIVPVLSYRERIYLRVRKSLIFRLLKNKRLGGMSI